MKKVILNYWSPRDKSVTTETGFCYRDMKPEIKHEKEITGATDISIFEQFYKLNNQLRYCNGSYYTFKETTWDNKYRVWLDSDDYKKKSFQLYYGNGVVD